MPGAPAEVEELMVARDIALVRLTGGRLHLLHLSSAGSVALVAAAKVEGLAVTAEATPHHLALTHAELAAYDTAFKVNPPLRTAVHRSALREACASGVIDADRHRSRASPRRGKEAPLCDAAPGVLGLETALAVVLGSLVRERRGAGSRTREGSRTAAWRQGDGGIKDAGNGARSR